MSRKIPSGKNSACYDLFLNDRSTVEETKFVNEQRLVFHRFVFATFDSGFDPIVTSQNVARNDHDVRLVFESRSRLLRQGTSVEKQRKGERGILFNAKEPTMNRQTFV